MIRPLPTFAFAGLLLLSGCAALPTTSREASVSTTDSAYGLFLGGEAAFNGGDMSEASRLFTRASRLDKDPILAQRALLSSILAGDMKTAASLAAREPLASDKLGRMATAVEALATGRGKTAFAVLSGEPVGYPYRFTAALLKPWAAAAAGDWKAALILPESRGDRVVSSLAALDHAILLERAGRLDEAEAAYKALTDASVAVGEVAQRHGEFLERRGRAKEALAVYEAGLAVNPDDAVLRRDRARAVVQGPPPAQISIQSGAAQSLVWSAVSAMAAKQSELTLVYSQMALRLDPHSDEAWLLVGGAKAAQEDRAAAREAYAHIGPSSPYYVEARGQIIVSYQAAGDKAQALQLARETVQAAPNDVAARSLLAEMLQGAGLWAESAVVLDGLIGQAGASGDWRFYFLRAIALDRSGRWPEAERDLLTGLKQQPDDAEMLNYLGYSWITRREHLPQALQMIQRAVIAEPASGAIVDSLGWAYYQLGDFKKATRFLEQAAAMESSDPEINNHLGDAYWRVGRKDEAQFQWRLVLTLDPTDAIRAEAEAKLKSGLTAAAPSAVVASR